ncbi:hypothetical protein QJS04_geneDACA000014 [Acorus gramineus]|uniref:DUF295 domain-containing protein n=1 Tax=Acorus gramineus TaxID=55184 RepID=A0AAV9ATU9_ACOGR|nr:hypothetical protein QJS04_geneDACA000014 [Acorus gramineus]
MAKTTESKKPTKPNKRNPKKQFSPPIKRPWRSCRSKNTTPTSPSTAATSSSSERDWSELPGPALHAVLLLLDMVDHLSFRGTCQRWRSASILAEREYDASRAPSLLISIWTHHDLYHLYSVSGGRTYMMKKLQELPGRRCIGSSKGYLILADEETEKPSLVDPFSTVRIDFPKPPHPLISTRFSGDGVLFSSDGRLIQYCRPGDAEWTVCDFSGLDVLNSGGFVSGGVYTVTEQRQLVALDFDRMGLKMTVLRALPPPEVDLVDGVVHLVDSDDELLMLYFHVDWRTNLVGKLAVYRLDFVKWVWMKLDSLGGRSLFVSFRRRCVSVTSMLRRGGRGDCVYFVGHIAKSVEVLSLNGTLLDVINISAPVCGLPVWICPSLCIC